MFYNCSILLQLFAHVQEITLQQNYMGVVAYANLRLSCGVLLTYLLTYRLELVNSSQHYDRDVDVMCNSSFAYLHACSNSPTRARKIVAAFILFYCT